MFRVGATKMRLFHCRYVEKRGLRHPPSSNTERVSPKLSSEATSQSGCFALAQCTVRSDGPMATVILIGGRNPSHSQSWNSARLTHHPLLALLPSRPPLLVDALPRPVCGCRSITARPPSPLLSPSVPLAHSFPSRAQSSGTGERAPYLTMHLH
jgi:hypothetical protein